MQWKKEIYAFAKKLLPRVLSRLLTLFTGLLEPRKQQLLLLELEQQLYLRRLKLLRQQQDWAALLQLAPVADTVLVVFGKGELAWSRQITELLRQRNPAPRVVVAQLRPALTGLSSAERFPFLLQGIDWQTQLFPPPQVCSLVIISPEIAALGHRPALLIWLQQRYQAHTFVLRLPMLLCTHDRLYRSRLGARLLGQQHYQLLYTPRSAQWEFEPWFEMQQLLPITRVGEIWCSISAKSSAPAQQELVSVVIPVYQVERFLPHCLASLQAQSWANWEALVVDDASRDASAAIVADLQQRDARIRLIRQPYNQGQAAARNLGLQQAQGEFLCFVDGDDFLHARYLETLALALRRSAADFVVCDLDEAHDPGPSIHCYREFRSGGKEDFLLPFESPYLRNSPWDKMFRRSRLVEKQLSFPQGHYYEDLPYTLQLSSQLGQQFYLPCTLIHYRHHPQSESRAPLRPKNISDHCLAMAAVQHSLQQKGSLQQLIGVVRYWKLLLQHLDKLLGSGMLTRPDLSPTQQEQLAQLAWQHSLTLWKPTELPCPSYAQALLEFNPQQPPLKALQQLRKLLAQLLQRHLGYVELPDNLPQYW